MDDHSQRWHGLLHRVLENWEGHAYRGTDCINPFFTFFSTQRVPAFDECLLIYDFLSCDCAD
jgi:hypothetical protein